MEVQAFGVGDRLVPHGSKWYALEKNETEVKERIDTLKYHQKLQSYAEPTCGASIKDSLIQEEDGEFSGKTDEDVHDLRYDEYLESC